MKVNAFISKSKSVFKELLKHQIVLGNQSADLDSIVSAISMSFFLTTPDSRFIPVINTTKDILMTKHECLYLMKELSINLDDLIFLSDFKSKEILKVVLVDHNELDNEEKSMGLSDRVISIIDHHIDKNNFLDTSPRLIDTTAGSNATLISHMFYEAKSELPESFASMLLFPILADTNNLTCRASQKDFEMTKYLTKLSGLNCDNTYKNIEAAKFDQSNMDTLTLLKKDYKQYSNNDMKWGMSSVTLNITNYINADAENILKEVSKFMIEKELFLIGMLSLYKNTESEFKRDMSIMTNSKKLLDSFNETQNPNLSLKETCSNEKLYYSIYDVGEVKLTRKYWQPVLEEFLKKNL